MKYAKDTSVSSEQSKAEIERTVMRYGATGFASGWIQGMAVISFEMRDRRIRFNLPLPSQKDRAFTHAMKGQNQFTNEGVPVPRAPELAMKMWEQACRQRWRALALAVKAKLEAVESGIATFEEEFMAQIVLPNGRTLGEAVLPQIAESYRTGKMPPLLPGPTQ